MRAATPQDLYHGARLSCVEMLLNGITTFADMWPEVTSTARAVEQVGSRALLAHNLRDFGDPARTEQEIQAGFTAWKEWNGQAGGRIRVSLGPHSVYAASEALLKAVGEVAGRHQIPVQIHLAETRKEVDDSQRQFGLSPVQYLKRLGLLDLDVLAAHCVWLSEQDIEILAGNHVAVAHCMASNLKLASGIAPVPRLLQAGITVGLGTDGPASNNTLDLFADLKWSALVQKGILGDATLLPAEESLGMVTRSAARALGWEHEIGSIKAGKKADLILLNLASPHLTPLARARWDQLYAHLVYCTTGRDVETVIVDGRLVVQDRRLLTADVDQVMDDAQTSANRILAQL
jgi:5-methylthioadenosine/S-adenosylhomocysteine deaminase